MLCQSRKRAWEALLLSFSSLAREIDLVLQATTKRSLQDYDALLMLEIAPENRRRIGDLACLTPLTPSGVTRLVDRLERDGLVHRHSCPNDRRSIWVSITEAGIKERERMWETYSAEINKRFAEKITDEDAKDLNRILERFVAPEMFITPSEDVKCAN